MSDPLSRRRLLALGGAGLAAACAPATGDPPPGRDLADHVRSFTEGLTASMAYRAPDEQEAGELVPALLRLAESPDDRGARDRLARYDVGVDVLPGAGGRRYVVATSDASTERSWGLYAFPVDTPMRLLVEVPHPVADRDTERVGLDLLAALPGAVLLQAGAHRRAADSRADVAHQPASLFHRLATRIAQDRRLPQIQLHGFDDAAHDPDVNVVLSPGAAEVTPIVEAAADRFADDDLAVCRVWSDDCPDLAGRTNVQGIAARAAGLPFLHVELDDGLRGERDRRARVARALERATRAGTG